MTRVEIVRELPPDIWLKPCTGYLPDLAPLRTNEDVTMVIAPMVSALLQCDEDKKSLREWKNQYPTPPLQEAP